MESPHPDVLCFAVTNQGKDAIRHFPCSLISKGERKDRERIHSKFQEVSNTESKNPGLARACPGNDHYRAFGFYNSLALCFIQFIKDSRHILKSAQR